MGADGHVRFDVPRKIILAHEGTFSVGRLHFTPAVRQVRDGGSSQTLEPRVMQVLVALARAQGEVVTRDDLIASCWDGRAVGDDSINRVLSRLRRLASDVGGGSFAIETIPRVGYRLVEREPGTSLGLRTAGSRAGAFGRRAMIGGAAAATLIATAAMSFWPRSAAFSGPAPEARDLYHRAVAFRQNGRLKENREAIALLREAVRLSPEYGEAWGLLALAYRMALEEEPPERIPGFEQLRREAARNAQRHDPGNGDAYVAMLPFWTFLGRWAEAEEAYRSVIQRRPQYARGHYLLGSLLMDVGRWSEAVVALTAAKALDPATSHTRYKLAVALWSAGQINRAEHETNEALRLWPQQGPIWQTKIKLLALSGRAREALALAADPASRPLDDKHAPDPEGRRLYLTALATRSPKDVSKALDHDKRKARALESERINAALRAVSLSAVPLGLDILEGIYLGRGEWRIAESERKWLPAHPLFQPHAEPLWREPRFETILQAIGLARYWRVTGKLPDYRRLR